MHTQAEGGASAKALRQEHVSVFKEEKDAGRRSEVREEEEGKEVRKEPGDQIPESLADLCEDGLLFSVKWEVPAVLGQGSALIHVCVLEGILTIDRRETGGNKTIRRVSQPLGRRDEVSERRVSRKWRKTDSWYILKTKPTGLADRLDMGCERQEVEDDSHLPSE